MNLHELDAFVLPKLAEFQTAGASIALIQEDRMVDAKGYGFRDVEAVLPYTAHTNGPIASVTKSFTALAILMLAENGALSVDDTVNHHLPEFDIQPEAEPIRIRHLLSHSSGIPSLTSSEMEWAALTGATKTRYPLASHDSLLAYGSNAQQWLIAAPGEQMRYCNYGFHLLGAIIKRRANMPYEDFITDHILKPLKMKHSYFTKTRYEADEDASSAYIISQGARKKIPMPFRAVTAAGGLFSNGHDLARYLRMFLNEGQLDERRILSPAGVQSMTRPHITLPKEGRWHQSSYGFGLMRSDDFYGQVMMEHGGGLPFATSYIAWIPATGMGVAVLLNGVGYPTWRIAQVALALLLQEDWRELPFLKRERRLAALVGSYSSYRAGLQCTVRLTGDQLFMEQGNAHQQTSVPLLEEQYSETECQFVAPMMGERLSLMFKKHPSHIDLHMDRYVFRKKI